MADMSEWISFDERYPDEFPCLGRNYDFHIEDVITGMDNDNKAFKHACFCRSIPLSMPFTHWKELIMNEWISVKDRLPDKEVYVLVYHSDEIIKPIDVGYFSLIAKMWNVGFMKSGIVTHSMPLPDPPEKDNG